MNDREREALIAQVGPDVADSLIRNFDVTFHPRLPELNKKPSTTRRRRGTH